METTKRKYNLTNELVHSVSLKIDFCFSEIKLHFFPIEKIIKKVLTDLYYVI